MPRGEKVALGEISAPEDRVIRITSFHWDASDADVTQFFEGYGLVDWKRDRNVKSGKSTVAYVLLDTLEQVVHAIEELHLKELAGRQVRIMRAKGGFTLNQSGRLRLTYTEQNGDLDKHSKASKAPVRHPTLAHNMSHELSFPPLPGNPEPASARGYSHHALVHHQPPEPSSFLDEERDSRTPRRRLPQHAGPDGPEHRVLLISKLHPDANRNAIELFFKEFRIVDYKRNFNGRLKRYNNIAFVMFQSVQHRDHARAAKDGGKVLGRAVSLEIATKGIRVSEYGFLPDDKENFVSPPASRRRVQNWPTNESSPVARMPASYRYAAPYQSNVNATVGLGIDFGKGAPTEVSNAQVFEHHGDDRAQDSKTTVPTQNQQSSSEQPGDLKVQIAHHYHPGVGGGHAAALRFLSNETQTLEEEQVSAHYALGPWNIASNDSEDRRYNVVTEADWYSFMQRLGF